MEEIYKGFGTCKACGKERQVLTENPDKSREALCPQCAFPRPGITTEEMDDEGIFDDDLRKEGYTPVTGMVPDARLEKVFNDEKLEWEEQMTPRLVGYIHPGRSRDGWDALHTRISPRTKATLRLGTPNDYCLSLQAVAHVLEGEPLKNFSEDSVLREMSLSPLSRDQLREYSRMQEEQNE